MTYDRKSVRKPGVGKLQESEAAYIEVLGVNVTMLRHVEVLLGHEHTLYQTKSVKLSFRG